MKQFAFTPEVFTIEAAAHYMGVSKRQVEDWIYHGMIHTSRYRAGQSEEFLRKTVIRKRDLDRFIEAVLIQL